MVDCQAILAAWTRKSHIFLAEGTTSIVSFVFDAMNHHPFGLIAKFWHVFIKDNVFFLITVTLILLLFNHFDVLGEGQHWIDVNLVCLLPNSHLLLPDAIRTISCSSDFIVPFQFLYAVSDNQIPLPVPMHNLLEKGILCLNRNRTIKIALTLVVYCRKEPLPLIKN